MRCACAHVRRARSARSADAAHARQVGREPMWRFRVTRGSGFGNICVSVDPRTNCEMLLNSAAWTTGEGLKQGSDPTLCENLPRVTPWRA
eukprot:5555588-Prymnesium_polylepis.2